MELGKPHTVLCPPPALGRGPQASGGHAEHPARLHGVQWAQTPHLTRGPHPDPRACTTCTVHTPAPRTLCSLRGEPAPAPRTTHLSTPSPRPERRHPDIGPQVRTASSGAFTHPPPSLTPPHKSTDRRGAAGSMVSWPPEAPHCTTLTGPHAAISASLIRFQVHTRLGVQLPPESGVWCLSDSWVLSPWDSSLP